MCIIKSKSLYFFIYKIRPYRPVTRVLHTPYPVYLSVCVLRGDFALNKKKKHWVYSDATRQLLLLLLTYTPAVIFETHNITLWFLDNNIYIYIHIYNTCAYTYKLLLYFISLPTVTLRNDNRNPIIIFIWAYAKGGAKGLRSPDCNYLYKISHSILVYYYYYYFAGESRKMEKKIE